jgi:hypothetical protein
MGVSGQYKSKLKVKLTLYRHAGAKWRGNNLYEISLMGPIHS